MIDILIVNFRKSVVYKYSCDTLIDVMPHNIHITILTMASFHILYINSLATASSHVHQAEPGCLYTKASTVSRGRIISWSQG